MSNEIIDLLLRLNLALAAGVAIVLALRLMVRRWFGARIAYALWLIPVVAALACFVPGRVETVVLQWPDAPAPPAVLAAISPEGAPDSIWTWAWAFGALVSLSILAIRQARFTQSLGRLGVRADLGKRVCAAESNEHGPAVVGVLRPVIVTPADFEARFDAEERRLVLAHERAHLAHGDPWINAVVLALQCLNWFNPFVHFGARMLRIDQELACDAAVLAQSDGARRRYAEAMLKTHLAAAVPIGCAWPASNVDSFKERIAMLKRSLPSRTQTTVGAAVILAATSAVAAVAWAAQPPRVVATYAERAQRPDVTARVHPISLTEQDLAGGDAMLDIDLDGGRDGVIVIDGDAVRASDMTPEQREELRRTLAEAREQMAMAREEMARANDAIRTAVRASAEGQRLSDEDMEELHQAIEEARISQEELRQAHLEAMADARESMREAQAELAAARVVMRDMPDMRAALRQAEVEVTRAMQQARVAGDRARAEALARAAAALDRAGATASEDIPDPEDVPDLEGN